jgi:hypothetical protein
MKAVLGLTQGNSLVAAALNGRSYAMLSGCDGFRDARQCSAEELRWDQVRASADLRFGQSDREALYGRVRLCALLVTAVFADGPVRESLWFLMFPNRRCILAESLLSVC